MKRPAFQMYAKDWLGNAKLRRCSPAARGAWIDVMCLMHDSEEYGVLRWPLVEIARAANVPIALLKELASRQVLKGAESGAGDYVYRPRHAGKIGDPVTLLVAGDGPCWYCSRFVRDEWIRQSRGKSTHFTSDRQPVRDASADVNSTPEARQGETPKVTPIRPVGVPQGDGPAVAIAVASLSTKEKRSSRKRSVSPAPMPDGFAISERVRKWATEKGFDRLDDHFEVFCSKVRAKGYTYVDWNDGFMGCVREDWGRLRQTNGSGGKGGAGGPDWWASNEGIDKMGREIDMTARPSESYPDFKQRIFDRLRATSSTPKARASQ